MARTLSIANKLLSLRGRMEIADDAGHLAYEARGEWEFFSRTWTIFRGEARVAGVRRKILSFVPRWRVDGEAGSFEIRRRVFSWRRRYDVVGGPMDGAAIAGNLFDLRFEITQGRQAIARATGKLFSLRDRHRVEVLGDAELFTVIVMVVLQGDRREQSSGD